MSPVSTSIPKGAHALVEVNGRQNFKSLFAGKARRHNDNCSTGRIGKLRSFVTCSMLQLSLSDEFEEENSDKHTAPVQRGTAAHVSRHVPWV